MQWYQPPVIPERSTSGYWVIKRNSGAPRHDIEWINEAATGSPMPSLGRFEEYLEPVKWRSKKPVPKRFAELSIGLSHKVSERVLDLFREFDPDGVKWHPIDLRFKHDEPSPINFYWMHVTRKIKAIDYANSQVRYQKSAGYPVPAPVQFGSVRLLEAAFGHPYFCCYPSPGWSAIFVSDAMRRRFKSMKLGYLTLQNSASWPLVI